MPNLRPVSVSENPLTSWQSLIQRTVQAQNVVTSGDLLVNRTGDFTKISLGQIQDADHLIWRGNFDMTQEYRVNDVVRVVPDVVYTNPNTSASVEIGATSEAGYGEIPISLGLFVCVQYVPPSWCDAQYFFNTVVNAFPNAIPYEYQVGIRWYEHNCYYPVFPEIPSNFTTSVDTGYGFSITANSTFWQALPFGTMPLKICTNGTQRTFYVVGAESGSLFKTEYLPYTT